MIQVHLNRTYRVTADARVRVALPPARVANEMNSLRHFITHDLFHARLEADHTDTAGEPEVKSPIQIEHRLGPFTIVRDGRMLWRDPDRGFGFTDLSRRNPRRGFPHSCHYRFSPDDSGNGGTWVHFAVRGRWTGRRLPRFIVRGYLVVVMWFSRRALQSHFSNLERWTRRAQPNHT